MAENTEIDLDAIEERVSKATPGPWKVWGMDVLSDRAGTGDVDDAGFVASTSDPDRGLRTFNADFIGASREDVPALVAELRSRREDPRDEYHSMRELYDYRMLYNALSFNSWAEHGTHPVVKSWRHSDGELCFGGGWFVVVASLPSGQVSNHYRAEHWDLFRLPEELPPEYDGHSPSDAAERMRAELLAPARASSPVEAAERSERLCPLGGEHVPVQRWDERLRTYYDRCESCGLDLEADDAVPPTLEAAVLDTEDRAARFDGIFGAIRDFAKGRPQADAWEEIVRIALHDQDDSDLRNDPEPPHLLTDWVSSELAVARAAGQLEGVEMLRPRVVETVEELEALWGRGVVLHSEQVGAILPADSVGWWYVAMQGPHFGWLSHALLEDYGPVSVLAVPPTAGEQ